MAATAMEHDGGEVVTPWEHLGSSSSLAAGRGSYADGRSVHASVTGRRLLLPPPPGASDQRYTVEVVGHKAHGAVPQPGSVVIARLRSLSLSKPLIGYIMCVDSKAVKERFTGMIRQQDVRATEIDKVDMYQSYRSGDIIRALVLCLGDARAYYLSTAKNELRVVSAQSIAGGTLVPTSWTEMQCELTGQTEQRKVAKVTDRKASCCVHNMLIDDTGSSWRHCCR